MSSAFTVDDVVGTDAGVDCSNSLSLGSQVSLKLSPWISHILCRIQHANIKVGMCTVCMSFLFMSRLHLLSVFRMHFQRQYEPLKDCS